MANHKSSKKRILQTAVKTERNRFYKTRLKNIVKEVEANIAENDSEKANNSFKIANKFIHKCVSKGILKKNTASRKVSRLNKLVNNIAS
jgi:small subunit ribosomal protein S20